MTRSQRALVVSIGKNVAWIRIDGEQEPRVAQLRRMRGKRSMPVPGDVAHVVVLEDGRTLVERVEPRRSTLERRTVAGRTKTMAANVDLLVIVTALANPSPRLPTLDQLLAFSELEEIGAAVVFTKPDLADPEQARALLALYAALGYAALCVNAKAGKNVDALRALIQGHHAMLVGNSGVGKSTIFRALGGDASVGNVSRHGLGRQTTTAGRLYRFAAGFLIDSPGIAEFGLGNIQPSELAAAFREIRETASGCRFSDCTHLREPGCAVRASVEAGGIAVSRYASYRAILADA
ncbi:MAG: ribosome small subunit-dependent GTPase A [Candidatus Eremiobacteraeota bacterium]|nr:ribosome small subunit-dependent GTPase A [Candidatus Eremiobacteraeota bacterium]